MRDTEVTARPKISSYTVRRLLDERKLRGAKIDGGRLGRVRRADFDVYLQSRGYQPKKLSPGMETAILSEPAISKEWLTPEEDGYWAHL